MASVNYTAKALKAMHVPASPIVFTNVWDAMSLNAVLSLNEGNDKPVKAVATASSAIAAAAGCKDEDLTFEQNIAAIRQIARLCQQAGVPLSADLQDGYGSRIEEVVTAAVHAGVSGANIEDSITSSAYGKLYPLDEQVRRLKSALKAAAEAGCPDFVLNARCDIFCLDDPGLDDDARLKEAIIRGKAFLELGATTVFYMGGQRRGLTKAHLQTLVKELDGRVAVLLGGYAGGPTVSELAELGVARVSIGDDLFPIAMDAIRQAALTVYVKGRLPA
jgi:2-methylisocitrate lyase-like PEP mutase family enzyme